jgi:Flp pilus assembly protein TadG
VSSPRRGRASGRRAERGQATVELALVLPFLAVLLLALVQVGLVVRDQLLVVHAAREAARAAAVAGGDAGEARDAALGSVGLPADHVHVETARTGGSDPTVTVTVRADASTGVPLVGPLLGHLQLTGRATMRLEPA